MIHTLKENREQIRQLKEENVSVIQENEELKNEIELTQGQLFEKLKQTQIEVKDIE